MHLHRSAFLLCLAGWFSLPAAYSPASSPASRPQNYFESLFGYGSVSYEFRNDLPEWDRILRRHSFEDFSGGQILEPWHIFIDNTRADTPSQQIKKVNRFANQHDYVLDIDNYGVEDYWAIVREFLKNNGDCEDYAITKYFSLRLLGFTNDSLRIVVLQDTNLNVAHAVVAVALDGDIFILDNQVNAVLSHKDILHYTPLYSINENRWWLHIPNT
nr:transglutaminase-like cysteine peptidase [Desulfobulbaceae bacterium]